MRIWSEEAFILSSTQLGNRHYSFDVPLPAKVVDVHVAERKEEGKSIVVMAQTLPMLAWRALVIAWYGAISEALEKITRIESSDCLRRPCLCPYVCAFATTRTAVRWRHLLLLRVFSCHLEPLARALFGSSRKRVFGAAAWRNPLLPMHRF